MSPSPGSFFLLASSLCTCLGLALAVEHVFKEWALAIPQRFTGDLSQLALGDQTVVFGREKQNIFLNVGC